MKTLTTYMKNSNEEIILWCYAETEKNKVNSTDKLKTTQKSPHANDGEKPTSKRDMCMMKI